MQPDHQLFDRFNELALELRNTASVVQNDHDRLIQDGAISAEDVRKNAAQFIERCEEHVCELLSLQSETLRRLDAVMAALEGR